MKNVLTVIAIITAVVVGVYNYNYPALTAAAEAGNSSDSVLADAFQRHLSHIQIQGQGMVVKILADDTVGSRHQRFILRLNSGQTILVVHNIDLAPRVSGLKTGDTIWFYGEYEWNPKGGIVHWTHHDPQGRHPGGWIKHGGRTYQ
jgi:hypothetical protein